MGDTEHVRARWKNGAHIDDAVQRPGAQCIIHVEGGMFGSDSVMIEAL